MKIMELLLKIKGKLESTYPKALQDAMKSAGKLQRQYGRVNDTLKNPAASQSLQVQTGLLEKLQSLKAVQSQAEQYRNLKKEQVSSTAEYARQQGVVKDLAQKKAQGESTVSNLKVQAESAKQAGNIAEYKQLQSAIKLAEGELRNLDRAFNQAKTAAASMKSSLASQASTLSQLRASLSAAGYSTANMVQSERNLQNAINQTNTALQRQAALSQRRQQVTANQQNASANFSNKQADLQGAMGTAKSLMNPFIDSVKTAASFEKGMSKVRAITGASDADMEKLTAQAKMLGATTQFTARESADAMTFLGMAGWKTNQILSAMPSMLSLAAAGDLDLARTADIVSDGLTALHMPADQAARFANVLAATSSNANTDVNIMGETFKYAAAVAGAYGLSLEDTAVATGLMANAGIKGSMSGTALRSVMQRLISPPKAAAEALKQLGFSAYDNQGKLKPFLQQIEELRGKMKTMRDSGQRERVDAMYKSIAGAEASGGFAALMTATDEDYQKQKDAIYKASNESYNADGSVNENGAAQKMSKIMQDNFEGSMVKVSSAIEAVYTSIGESFLPVLTAIGNAIADNIGKIAEWMGQHAAVIQWVALLTATIAALIVIISAAALAMSTWSFLSATVSSIVMAVTLAKEAFLGLSIVQRAGALASMLWTGAQMALNAALAMNPAALFIVGMIALIAAVTAVISHFDGLRNALTTAFNDPAGAIHGFAELIKSSIDAAIQYVMDRFNTLKSALANPLEAAANFFSTGSVVGGNVTAGEEIRQTAEAHAQVAGGIGAIQAQTAAIDNQPQTAAIQENQAAVEAHTQAIQMNLEQQQLEAQLEAQRAAETAANATPDIDDKYDVEDMLTVIQPLQDSVSTLQPNLQAVSDSTSSLSPNIQTIADSTQSLPPNLTAVNESFTSTQQSVQTLNEAITTASTSLTTINEAASTASTSLSGISASAQACASALQSAASQISNIHITIPSISTAPVASNADGGIYRQGAFLTTFAENSPEAAIPLDGSPNAISLWQQAGSILGVFPQQPVHFNDSTPNSPNPFNVNTPSLPNQSPNFNSDSALNINFAPQFNLPQNIQDALQPALQSTADDLESKILAVLQMQKSNERRTSYAS